MPRFLWCGAAAALLASSATAPAGPRVDVNPNSDRGDIVTRGWDNWKIVEAPTATTKFGPVTVTLKATDGRLTGGLWKPGYDHLATVASDGLTVAGPIEMTLSGLTPGRHSLVTYHNAYEGTAEPLTISVNGVKKVGGLKPTTRVLHDADATAGYVEFDAADGKDVVVTFAPEGSGKTVVLNGFEIDTADPARRATKTVPVDGDEHAPENTVLTWRPAAGATAHNVYLGTDPAAVAKATPTSPEFRGKVTEPKFDTASLKLNTFDNYYWRVDEIHPDRASEPTVGLVNRFRVRHLAFPEAEGYGRFAIGGRDGRVIEVTSLEDSGPGTLREAIEAEGPRTIVFRVGGQIKLKSKLIIKNPYVTVAGQTAPGDGICIRGYTFGCLGTHDAIVRHVRIRVGDESGQTNDGCGAANSDHVIYDHCSISWSIDEGFSSRQGKNITLQRSIIAEPLNMSVHAKYVGSGKGHSFAGSISGDIGSFHHNLLVHCAGRNWSLAGGLDRGGKMLAGRLDIRNNVVYNWSHRTTDGGVRELDFVNNYYLPGPASRNFTLLKPDPGDPDRGMRAYMDGNVIEGHVGPDDNWNPKAAIMPAADFPKVRSDKPLFESHVTTQSAKDAYESVIADVGATRPRQDAVDLRVIADVKNRGFKYTGSRGKLPGIIDSQSECGGWPEYKGGDAPADVDHDGMPDAWEKAHGLNPNDPADGKADRNGDGYTNLEEYLNALANGEA